MAIPLSLWTRMSCSSHLHSSVQLHGLLADQTLEVVNALLQRSLSSGQDPPNNLAMHVGQALVAAAVTEGQFRVVDAELM